MNNIYLQLLNNRIRSRRVRRKPEIKAWDKFTRRHMGDIPRSEF
jgi:hypothetical protein